MKPVDTWKTVAVIGGGFIGFSYGILFSRAGLDVRIYNRKSATYDAILPRMREEMDFLVAEGEMTQEDVQAALARVTLTDDLDAAVDGADYIQECLWEDLALKQKYFKELADRTGADVPIGSSCSGLRISLIAADVTNHPERCVTAHPTNPPHLIPFMEVAGDQASPEVKDAVCAFMRRVGQSPVQCREVYGYVLNRLQLSLIQEALYLVKEGICDVVAVESAITDGLGMRWAYTGPYGVEELNSASLGEGLAKYKDYMLAFFTGEQQKVEGYDDAFIEAAVQGFRPVMKGRSHDEYLKWRNKMLVATRKLKRENA
ncbi:MAG: hypothetical protein LBR44_08280 [Clostridiales Family XIII bacterium]|jgi:3-hydroxyacyl-CoA dehydrogenase|nr:hypothetical protein [Clostridiales Family XIII bacterium]